MHEREREIEAPLHAARVAGDLPIGGIDEPHAVEQLLRARAALLLGDALQRRLEAKVVARGEERVERGLLERDADEPADLRPVLHDVVAADERRPGGRRQQRGQDVDGGRLPGPVRPEEAVDLTRRDGEVDPVDGPRTLLVLADEPANLDPVLGRHRSTLPTARRRSAERLEGEARRDDGLPAALVRDVDRVVLAVRPGDTDPQREPAPEAELALGLQLAIEDERAARRCGSRRPPLRDAVHEHLERPHDVGGQPYASSPIRALRHVHRMAAGAGFDLVGFLAQFAPVAPESPNAEGIRDSYLFVSIFVFAIFVLVEGLLIAFIWKYRRQKRPRFEDGAQIHGATKLELAWTAFPVVVLFLIARLRLHRAAGNQGHPGGGSG